MSVDYRSYIASNDWAVRRVAALERTIKSYRYPECEMCGRRGVAYKNRIEDRRYRIEYANGLEVHHLNYRSLGQEEPEDLIVLCTDSLFWDDYHRAYSHWNRSGRQESGLSKPIIPERVGCHERVHDDPSFKREVARIASERW